MSFEEEHGFGDKKMTGLKGTMNRKFFGKKVAKKKLTKKTA